MEIRVLRGTKMAEPVDINTIMKHGYMVRAIPVGTVITVRDSIRPDREYGGRFLPREVFYTLRRSGRKICALGYDKDLDEFYYCVMVRKKPYWLSCGIVKKKKEKLIRFGDMDWSVSDDK